MDPHDRRKLTHALQFALDAHREQCRKGKDVPYASHLLQVAGLVLEYGGRDIDLAVAGLLHDVLEDTCVPETEIVERFGERVRAIVRSCTDLLEGDTCEQKSEWKLRKEAYVERFAGEDSGTQTVAACDKLHNLTNLVADLRAQGPAFLDDFNGGRDGTLWYFAEIEARLRPELPEALRCEFRARLEELRVLVRRPG